VFCPEGWGAPRACWGAPRGVLGRAPRVLGRAPRRVRDSDSGGHAQLTSRRCPLLCSPALSSQRNGPQRLSRALRQACLFGGAGEEGPLGDAWLLEGGGGGAAPRWRRAAAEAAAGRAWHAAALVATPEARARLGRRAGAVSHESAVQGRPRICAWQRQQAEAAMAWTDYRPNGFKGIAWPAMSQTQGVRGSAVVGHQARADSPAR